MGENLRGTKRGHVALPRQASPFEHLWALATLPTVPKTKRSAVGSCRRRDASTEGVEKMFPESVRL